MTKLNQIVAVEKGVKSKAESDLTRVYHNIQQTQVLSGISRTYEPKDEDGDRYPPERTLVQYDCERALKDAQKALTRLFDVYLTKEDANTTATADVTVNGEIIVANVPVTYLLFLERQLIDIRAMVAKMPTLDPSERWQRSEALGSGVWETEANQKHKTKKVPRTHVLYEATDKHPAQVQMFTEDQVEGYWTTVKFSGALPADRKTELIDRIDTLANAVKYAREQANNSEVSDRECAEAVFGYLFR